jgi:RNA-directed DNA polymerase
VVGSPHQWEVGDGLAEIIKHTGFSVNLSKTRMQYRNSRQEVTGLVVNKKVNVKSDYRRNVRAMVQSLFQTGHFYTTEPPKAGGAPVAAEGSIPELQGMLGFIDSVDRHNAVIELRGDDGKLHSHRGLRSKRKVYRRFLIFKEFYAANVPVILCEGKTDNIYILHAIKNLATNYPTLAALDANGNASTKVRIVNTQSNMAELLQLGRGSSDQDRFIDEYLSEIKTFSASGASHPVILLIDNDDGAKTILNKVAKLTKTKPSRNEDFIHISQNLYLVMTPLNGNSNTTIEDFFPDSVKKVELGGKTFHSKGDPNLNFGKGIFARYVSENSSTIDFSGFKPILDRLTLAINSHYPQIANPPTANAAGAGTAG